MSPSLADARLRFAAARPHRDIEASVAVHLFEEGERVVLREAAVGEQAFSGLPESFARYVRVRRNVRDVVPLDEVDRNGRIGMLDRAETAAEERGEAGQDRVHIAVGQDSVKGSEAFRRFAVDAGDRLAFEDGLDEGGKRDAVVEVRADDSVEDADLVAVDAVEEVAQDGRLGFVRQLLLVERFLVLPEWLDARESEEGGEGDEDALASRRDDSF